MEEVRSNDKDLPKLTQNEDIEEVYHDRMAMVLEHRKSIHKYDPDVAQAVAFLRELHNTDITEKELTPPKCSGFEGLKSISLNEINQMDHIYEDRVLRVTNIEPPRGYQFEDSDYYKFTSMSVALLVEDENGDVQRAFVYTYIWHKMMDEVIDKVPAAGADRDLKEKFRRGRELSIINPVIKMAEDGKLALVVNDIELLIVADKQEGFSKKCGFCGKLDCGDQRCGKCQLVYYCSKECQTEDWIKLKHKYVCKEKPVSEDFAERPPWSVYELKTLCSKNFFALDCTAVLMDFGFAKSSEPDDIFLLGVYQELIKYLRVDLVKLHKACIQGRLAAFIIDSYEDGPAVGRGWYYLWFLAHKHLVKTIYPLPNYSE